MPCRSTVAGFFTGPQALRRKPYLHPAPFHGMVAVRNRAARHGAGRLNGPAPIDATPEEVARALMQGPPKKDWRYLKQQEPE